MRESAVRVLFICSGNSARSIIAEAALNGLSDGKVRGTSAGNTPAQSVHPNTIRILRDHGYDTSALTPKSWDHFAQADTPEVDLVITVCDDVAAEACPVWPGRPAHAHWGMPDPVRLCELQDGDLAPFHETLRVLEHRIREFLTRIKDLRELSRADLEHAARLT
jgi:arsenate reductase (thioredoxin)